MERDEVRARLTAGQLTYDEVVARLRADEFGTTDAREGPTRDEIIDALRKHGGVLPPPVRRRFSRNRSESGR